MYIVLYTYYRGARMSTSQDMTDLAGHLEAAASLLRRLSTSLETRSSSDRQPDKSLTPDRWLDLARELHPALGERQEQILLQVAEAHPEGIGTGPISRTIDYGQTNTNLTLTALGRHGLVRRESAGNAYLYFLGPRLLESAQG
jgi:hypothetical protein